MSLQHNLSRFVVGDFHIGDLPAIALEAMKEGFESTSLHILAGLSADEDCYTIEQYFKTTLKELDLDLPLRRQAFIAIIIAIINDIFAGKIDVFYGVQNLHWNYLYGIESGEDVRYVYDGIGFSKAYGLFDTLDDLRGAGTTRWSRKKTNEELERELEQELKEELKLWVARFKG